MLKHGVIAAILGAYLITANFESPASDTSRTPASGATVPDSENRRATESTDTEEALERPSRLVITADLNEIFADVPGGQLIHNVLDPFLLKRKIAAYRIVYANGDALRSRIRQIDNESTFEINLLDGPPVTVVSRKAEEHSSGWQTGLASLTGYVKGDETSAVLLTVGIDGSINGVIRSRQTGRVKIEPVKNTPHHIIWKFGGTGTTRID